LVGDGTGPAGQSAARRKEVSTIRNFLPFILTAWVVGIVGRSLYLIALFALVVWVPSIFPSVGNMRFPAHLDWLGSAFSALILPEIPLYDFLKYLGYSKFDLFYPMIFASFALSTAYGALAVWLCSWAVRRRHP
jgi:hypothetical protein